MTIQTALRFVRADDTYESGFIALMPLWPVLSPPCDDPGLRIAWGRVYGERGQYRFAFSPEQFESFMSRGLEYSPTFELDDALQRHRVTLTTIGILPGQVIEGGEQIIYPMYARVM